jgi:hypothetical protein
MNEFYAFVGTKPKNYHVLDDDFISEFEMNRQGNKCPCELLNEKYVMIMS